MAADLDEMFVELAQLTNLDRTRWEEILSLPEELQRDVLANYRDMNWATPNTPTWTRVLAVLEVIGTIAGVVGGVAGATGAIRSLAG